MGYNKLNLLLILFFDTAIDKMYVYTLKQKPGKKKKLILHYIFLEHSFSLVNKSCNAYIDIPIIHRK